MSLSVFKPIRPLSRELPRLRGNIGNKGLKVRRALFGPVDHAKTEMLLHEELAQRNRNENIKWEFDFQTGKPLTMNNNNGRYAWKAVTPAKVFAPKKQLFDEEFDNGHLYPTLPDIPQPIRIETSSNDDNTALSSIDIPKRQSKITDFLKSRKRQADFAFAAKKSTSSSPIPAKRASQSS